MNSECALMEKKERRSTFLCPPFIAFNGTRVFGFVFFLCHSAESFYSPSHADIRKTMNTENSVRWTRCSIIIIIFDFNIRWCVEYCDRVLCTRYDGDTVRLNGAPDSRFIHNGGQDMMTIITGRRIF